MKERDVVCVFFFGCGQKKVGFVKWVLGLRGFSEKKCGRYMGLLKWRSIKNGGQRKKLTVGRRG